MSADRATRHVTLEVPARAELVGIARLVVSAFASLGRGASSEQLEDLKIAVSEVCTAAIEAGCPTLTVDCRGDDERLELTFAGCPDAFTDAAEPGSSLIPDPRLELIRALFDEADVASGADGTILRLVAHRETDPGFA